MILIIFALIFLLTMIIGVPIAFILGITSLTYLLFFARIPLEVVGQNLFSGVNSFVLLAIPFFIMAGELMNRTNITQDLIDFSDLLVGRLPGSLAQINIVVSILFAGLTGAAVADTAAIGSVLIPSMKKEGYSSAYSAAVTTASSIIGPIIPPSIVMVIYGSITGNSIGSLFVAGVVPGILIGLGLMTMALYFAVKENHPRRTTAMPFKKKFEVTKKAILGILAPVIIIGGILSGMFTPTEAAAVACAYAFLIGVLVFKNIGFQDIKESLYNSAVISATILLIISTADLFGMVLTIERIPTQIASLLMTYVDSKILFILIINVFLLFMGMIMETAANVILLAPILIPVAVEFGLHPLHFALIMLVNLNIGLTTPPLGVCMFTAVPIANTSFEKIARKVMPFVGMEIAVLLIISFVPELVLFVPRLFGFL